MKNILLSFTTVLICLLANAQVIPPKQVTDAFASKFTDAQKVEWGQENATEWEADFMVAGVEKSACYSTKGEWLETESAICRKDLPAEIYKTLALVFDGFEIEEFEGIEKPGFTGFEITLEKGGTEVEIQAAPDGTFTLLYISVEDVHEGQCCLSEKEKSCPGVEIDHGKCCSSEKEKSCSGGEIDHSKCCSSEKEKSCSGKDADNEEEDTKEKN